MIPASVRAWWSAGAPEPLTFRRRHRLVRALLWAQLAVAGTVLLYRPGPGAAAVWPLVLAALCCAADLAARSPAWSVPAAVAGLLATDLALRRGLPGWPGIAAVTLLTVLIAQLYRARSPVLLASTGAACLLSLAPDGSWSGWPALAGVLLLAVVVQGLLWRDVAAAQLGGTALDRQGVEQEKHDLRARARRARQLREAVQVQLAELAVRAELSAELAESVRALHASGGSVASHASRANQVMSEFAQAIVNINFATKDAETTWDVAHERLVATESTIGQLTDASAMIGGIATQIQDIAKQTRMLALNATVEAARAGPAGLSFGVVADEVRGLAHQVAEATTRISGVVGSIQTGTGAARAAVSEINTVLDQARRAQQAIAEAVELQTLAAEQAQSAIAGLQGDAALLGAASDKHDGAEAAAPEADLDAEIWL